MVPYVSLHCLSCKTHLSWFTVSGHNSNAPSTTICNVSIVCPDNTAGESVFLQHGFLQNLKTDCLATLSLQYSFLPSNHISSAQSYAESHTICNVFISCPDNTAGKSVCRKHHRSSLMFCATVKGISKVPFGIMLPSLSVIITNLLLINNY